MTAAEVAVIRAALPAVERCAYLNAGTNGPLPRAAAEAMADEVRRALEVPRVGAAAFAGFFEVRAAARAAFASVLGAPPEEVVLTGSTTAGVGLVIAGIDWRAGDEVVTTDSEHPGVTGPLAVAERRHGLAVRAVEAERVADAIGERTRLVAVSHVLWTTGAILPLEELAAAAHGVGAALLVDGAQSGGAIALDVAAYDADYYAVSGQKWLLGPNGSGALWVHPRRREEVWPALPGYLSFEGGDVTRPRDDAGRLDPGTIDTVTLRGAAAALGWVDDLPGGRAGWFERSAAAVAAAEARLRTEPGVSVAAVPDRRAGLIAFTAEGVDDVAAAATALAADGVLVRSIPGTPYLRLSAGAWTTAEDVEALLAALRRLRQ